MTSYLFTPILFSFNQQSNMNVSEVTVNYKREITEMKVIFLGTAGSYMSVSRSYPSILINDDLLLDCGEGTTQKLLKIDAIEKINTICITHLHNDHFLGLFSLLWYYMLSGRNNDLEIIGPPKIEDTINKILDLTNTTMGMRSSFNLNYFELEDIDKLQTLHRKYEINAIQVNHAIIAYAYRIEENGKYLCYSGDTAPSENLIRLAKNCDLLLCEASLPNKFKTLAHKLGHSTPYDLALMAKESKSKKVVMFHIATTFIKQIDDFKRQADKELNDNVIIAEDLMEIEI